MKTIFLVPPPALPVPAVQGGAVESLLTHLIRENERQGQLRLVCVSIPDPEAQAEASGYRHTKMLYLPRPDLNWFRRGANAALRAAGQPVPLDCWYQAVQKAVLSEQPDLLVAEGGNLTECGAISKAIGREKCLAHLHGQTSASEAMCDIYGGILALSDFVLRDYLSTATRPQKTFLLPNCIDTDLFAPAEGRNALRKELGFSDGDFVVMFCGRLEEDKGIHRLLDALEFCPANVKLMIVGSAFFGAKDASPFTERLRQAALRYPNRVVFTGYLSAQQLPRYYAAADCCCVPTLVEEAAGLVAIEAMACGLPVIATDSGGMPEYLSGSGALLVERDEHLERSIASRIRTLQGDLALRTRLRQAGLRRAADFSIPRYYQRFCEIISEFGD